MVGKKGDIFNFSIKFIDYEHDYIHDHRGVVKTLRTLKKVLKWWGKKDISSNLVWNPLTMSMAMTRGGSKNVTNGLYTKKLYFICFKYSYTKKI